MATSMGEHEMPDWRGLEAIDRDGDKIGKIRDVFVDEGAGQQWAVIRSGLLGRHERFVPLEGATEGGGFVRVGFEKRQIDAAPELGEEGPESQEQESSLYVHYGLAYAPAGDGGEAGHATEGVPAVEDRQAAAAGPETAA